MTHEYGTLALAHLIDAAQWNNAQHFRDKNWVQFIFFFDAAKERKNEGELRTKYQ